MNQNTNLAYKFKKKTTNANYQIWDIKKISEYMRIKENECKVELILSYLIANLMDSRYLLMLIKTKKK